MNYPQFGLIKKCPLCSGKMYYCGIFIEDDAMYLCFTCDDCNHEVYAYLDEEMQEICNELEDWSE